MSNLDPSTRNKGERGLLPLLRLPAFVSSARPASPIITEKHSEQATLCQSDCLALVSERINQDNFTERIKIHPPALTLDIPGGDLNNNPPSCRTPGSVRLLSALAGSARSSRVDLLDPLLLNRTPDGPLLTPKDWGGDLPPDTATTSGSYFPSLRRRISNLSLRSATSSIRHFVFGTNVTPPQIEPTPAVGKVEAPNTQTSIDSLRGVAETCNPVIPIIFEPSASSPVLLKTESPKSALLIDLPIPEPPRLTTDYDSPSGVFSDAPIEELHSRQCDVPLGIAIPPRRKPQTYSPMQLPTPQSASSISFMNSSSLTDNPEQKHRLLVNPSPSSLGIHSDRSSRLSVATQSCTVTSGDESEPERLKRLEKGWNTRCPTPRPGQTGDNQKRRPTVNRQPTRGLTRASSGSAGDSGKRPRSNYKAPRTASKSQKIRNRAVVVPSSLPSIPDTVTIQSAFSATTVQGRSNDVSSSVPNTITPVPRGIPIPSRNSTISSSMSARAIISQLVKNGCSDVTRKLDIGRCGELPIAGGGFGDVYGGVLTNGKKVAIKCARLFLNNSGDGNKMVKNIAREIYTWSKLEHPNVLPLVGLATFRKKISIVSPWMENGTLREYISKNPNVDRFQLCTQISAGLAYLHSRDIVHGDVKGMNVLISADGVPKLTDFGNTVLKKCTIEFTGGVTTLKVSIRWTAPKMLSGESECFTKPGDIFALGMVFFETVTGKTPFEDKREAIVLTLLMRGESPEVPEKLQNMSERQNSLLQDIMQQCWRFKPQERPTASQLNEIDNPASLTSIEGTMS